MVFCAKSTNWDVMGQIKKFLTGNTTLKNSEGEEGRES